jgi:hypothetical protein
VLASLIVLAASLVRAASFAQGAYNCPLAPNSALSPMIRTSGTIIPVAMNTAVIVPLSVELPFTIFVGSNGILESCIDVGAVTPFLL